MTLRITDTEITSDEVDVTASRRDGLWFVTTYPGRAMDQNDAITAVSLAELHLSDLARSDPQTFAVLAAAWREELGLS